MNNAMGGRDAADAMCGSLAPSVVPALRTIREGRGTQLVFSASDLKAGPPACAVTFGMRKFAFAVFILFLVLPCSGQPTQGKAKSAIESGKPNYTITITPPTGPLSLKLPLLIEIYYTNTATSDIYVDAQICPICTAERILITKDGKEVETTPFQRMSTGRGLPSDFEELHKKFPQIHGSGHPTRYRPGVFWKVNLDLRNLYNITEPGEYTLIASRTDETKEGKVVVKSNAVTFDIVP